MDLVSGIFSKAADIVMVFGPTIGFFLQYKMIKRTGSLGSFSIDVCAILLIANIIRILFWSGKRFEVTLLFQSIVMIVAQMLLLNVCVTVREKTRPIYSSEDKSYFGNFWRWREYTSYLKFIIGFAAILSFLTINLGSPHYFETIGYASVIIEACLGMPQLINNYRNKTTQGLSIGLIGLWFFGDSMKTAYFVLKSQPMQFVMCGTIQLLVDTVILGQIYYYDTKIPYTKLEQ